MISFLKSFGEVIVSSNLRETKGYSPGFFFCGPKKSAEKSKQFFKYSKREIEWRLFQFCSTFHFGVKSGQRMSSISVKTPYQNQKMLTSAKNDTRQ